MTDAVKMAIEALRPFADAAGHIHPAHPDEATSLDGFPMSDFRRAAETLAALEQAGKPVSGIGHGEEADYAELKRLYNFSDDDSAQFTRWNMLTAIRHGKRLGQEFDAGEAKAYLYERGDSSFFEREMKPAEFYPNWKITPLYDHPAPKEQGDYHEGWEEGFKAARGRAFDGEGEARADDIRRSIIRQLGDDPHADRIILPGTDWDIVLAALSSAKRGEER